MIFVKIFKPLLATLLAVALMLSFSSMAFARIEVGTEIGTPAQLVAFIDAINSGSTFKDVTVKLTADIDMKNVDWVMAGNLIDASFIGYEKPQGSNYFDGTFDGQNFSIKNLKGSAPGGIPGQPDVIGDNIMGLFACLGKNGTIKNLNIKNADITGRNSVSILVALNMGTIDNCTISDSKITSREYSVSPKIDPLGDIYFAPGSSGTGGFAGMNTGTVSNCKAEGLTIIRGNAGFGGIVGVNFGTVDSCTTSKLSFTNYSIPLTDNVRWGTIGDEGGIVGSAQQNANVYDSKGAIVKNCVNYSDIKGIRGTGGICGYQSNATIIDCKNYGNISYDETPEQIVDEEEEEAIDGQWFGGICGVFWALGNGVDTQVIHCYNEGNVSGRLRVGGIIGSADNMAGGFDPDPDVDVDDNKLIEKCFNSGNVSATRNQVGGISGKSDAPVYGCFNTGDVSLKVSEDNDEELYIIGGVSGVLNNFMEECGNSGKIYFERNTEFKNAPVYMIGGVAGYSKNSHIWSSYSIGSVNTNIPESLWEDDLVFIGGVAGYIPPSICLKNYFTSENTMAKVEIGNIIDSAEGISLEKMRSSAAKENMPGIFEGKKGYFQMADDYYADDILYATYPFIESSFMDKTTLAVAIGHAPEKPEEKKDKPAEDDPQKPGTTIDNDNPYTGDNSNVMLFTFMLLLSAFAAAVVIRKIRKA